MNYPPEVVEAVCEESCQKHVGGMEMLKGETLKLLEGYYESVGERLWSSVVFYPSLADMCDGCK